MYMFMSTGTYLSTVLSTLKKSSGNGIDVCILTVISTGEVYIELLLSIGVSSSIFVNTLIVLHLK